MSEITLSINGHDVCIRPIQASDVTLEADFILRLSPESRHSRFLGGISSLSERQLQELCDLDHDKSMAFIAIMHRDEKPVQIGVSRYSRDKSGDEAEFAVTVSDEWQGHGLGTRLLALLISYAQEHGIRALYSVDSHDNKRMRRLAAEFDMDRRADPDDPHLVIHRLVLPAGGTPQASVA